ncbi:hypothetical protein [Schlesneria sp. DSM 10557]|uniref:hypothetical protein n=1 Tax=Schlesneria sp. DSM 10557 TaxID=3044399 RepID=UPI00359F585A
MCSQIASAHFGRILRDRRLVDVLTDFQKCKSNLEVGIAAATQMCEADFTVDDFVIGASIVMFFEDATGDYMDDSDKQSCVEAFKELVVSSATNDAYRLWAKQWFPTIH